MFSDTVTYVDFNGNTQTDTLWFNISQADVLEDISLIDRAEAVDRLVQGDRRELNTAEKQQILDLVKDFMRLAYGVKSADGRHFRKTKEIWEDFRWSNAYDKYLTDLFVNPERAAAFGANVLPKDLRDRAAAEQAKRDGGAPANHENADDRPQWLKDGRAPSIEELKASDPKWHMEAFRLKSENQS